jgi:glycosyltransferase involved in cell wall biosynthesis
MAVRADWQTRRGGDTVQMEQTAAHLEKSGVAVIFRTDPSASLSDVDLVHLTHLSRVHVSWPHFRAAQAAGKPVVMSTIYFRTGGPPSGLIENAKLYARWLSPRGSATRGDLFRSVLRGYDRARREMATGCLLLPNSRAELRLLEAEFGSNIRARVIPNAVDAAGCRQLAGRDDIPRKRQILCVGHFDPRKNQHALAQAMHDTDVPVVFIGQERGFLGGELRATRRWARPAMQFLGSLPHAQVLQHMRQSAVVACPSFYETPGLASLEAGAMGCNLALARCEPVEEYFKDQVHYFDALDIADIRRGVLAALEGKANANLAERIFREFDWSAAARQTNEAYEAAMDRNSQDQWNSRGI